MRYIFYNLLFIAILLCFSCCPDRDQSQHENELWNDFSENIEKGNVQYLVDHSFDSIKCIDCVPGKGEQFHSSIFIFNNHLNELYNIDALTDKEYSVYQDDSTLRISYSFENNFFGNESSMTVFMFDKKDNQFLFSGMITIP